MVVACDRCHFYFVDLYYQNSVIREDEFGSGSSEILLEIEGI